MTNPLIPTEYACETPCKYCRLTGNCPRVNSQNTATVSSARKRVEDWYPNREKDTPLECGCFIPWPIVVAFGQQIHGRVWCDLHGWQPELKKKDIENAKKVARKAADAQTFDDIPPF